MIPRPLLVAGVAMLLVACQPATIRHEPPPPAVVTPATPPPAPPPPVLRYESASWTDLPGWSSDDIVAAWPALLTSCRAPRMAPVWSGFCSAAQAVGATDAAAQRALVEARLKPWHIITLSQDGRNERRDQGTVTGYYEPVVNGARKRGGAFQTPLYAVPDDLLTIDLGDLYPQLKGERIRGRLQGKRVTPYPDREHLADGKLLAGKELVWLDSAADAFFLQIQGSGRVRLTDGSAVRLSFADVNGQPYKSIGKYLVDHGEMTVEQAALPNLKLWLAAHPERQAEIFNANPSVVFFKEEQLGDPSIGPKGALGLPLTAGRSVAIDQRQLPLGAPLYLATKHPLTHQPLARMVFGQDTGGAIRGALRADFFWGLGSEAGEAAGAMREQGSFWLLWPADQPPPVPAS
ncbi:MAG: murein transglycosylase A [Pseudomonadota bacterium]